MVTPEWLAKFSNWNPVIQAVIGLAGVAVVFKYMLDTAKIKNATYQPLLVLKHELRDATDQILSQFLDGSGDPTPSTQLAGKLLVRNIGTGPAHDVVFTFQGVERIGTLSSSIPYIEPERGVEIAIPKGLIKRGGVTFEAVYSGLSGVRFQSRQPLSDGVLGQFTSRNFGVVRRSYARLKRAKHALDAKLQECRTRTKIAAAYKELSSVNERLDQMPNEAYVVMTVKCSNCSKKQVVQVRARLGFGGYGPQAIKCVDCERVFDTTVPDQILGGPFHLAAPSRLN